MGIGTLWQQKYLKTHPPLPSSGTNLRHCLDRPHFFSFCFSHFLPVLISLMFSLSGGDLGEGAYGGQHSASDSLSDHSLLPDHARLLLPQGRGALRPSCTRPLPLIWTYKCSTLAHIHLFFMFCHILLSYLEQNYTYVNNLHVCSKYQQAIVMTTIVTAIHSFLPVTLHDGGDSTDGSLSTLYRGSSMRKSTLSMSSVNSASILPSNLSPPNSPSAHVSHVTSLC